MQLTAFSMASSVIARSQWVPNPAVSSVAAAKPQVPANVSTVTSLKGKKIIATKDQQIIDSVPKQIKKSSLGSSLVSLCLLNAAAE